ncbi:Annexin A10, partial [Chelonia mydas]
IQGTIFPAPNFNPVIDAQMLGGALQGIGCEKDMVIDILTQRCNAQRLMIAEAYREMYGRVIFWNPISGMKLYRHLIDRQLLYMTINTSAGFRLSFIIYVTVEVKHLFRHKELRRKREYNNDLQQDIYSETSGHFRDTLMNLAQVLWEACQQKTGEHKNMMQMILCNKSYQQLWMVLCVRDKPSYFAYRLYNAIHEYGFHNKTVIRILIARSEIDLMNIRRRYKERYGKSLFHDIKHFASGHYETALLAICAGDAEDY